MRGAAGNVPAVTVLAIVLLVVAVATLVWAASSTRAASTARAEAERLRGAVVDAEEAAAEAADLAAAEARRADAAEEAATRSAEDARVAAAAQAAADEAAAVAARQADEAVTGRADAERTAELAQAAADEAVERAVALEVDLTAARAGAVAAEERLAEATERVASLEEALAEAARPAVVEEAEGDGSPAPDLWPLEVRRLDRLWRERVSVVPTDPPPVADGDEPVRAAVGVVTEASREESGVVVELCWAEDLDVPASRAALVVRVAEELVAAAHVTDGGDLAVEPAEGGIALVLRTEPPVGLPPDLLATFASLGCELPVGEGVVTVVVPT